ncbi:uncharacterized protein BKA55DRAFT_711106 [Fusarium redolens]|uniref:C2H2-type domain-containing protein n=1 Tax=Fusarium redolens TaxID=48865 RepID=A0A9P9KQW2_FUSRE|nr:uncharacterized protein BKA55DRAFT_711106 [Fusarium redolens]KAH7266778.1 hypothetical protein BKA55DRAFT_711106 [Fusarium redolens]
MVEAPELAVRAFPSLLSMESKIFPCQYGSFRDCDETFQTQAEASTHLIIFHNADPVHRNEEGRYLCHYSQGSGTAVCQETFLTVTATVEHLDMRYPCPRKKDLGCDADFSREGDAKLHAREKHDNQRKVFPCPKKQELGCEETFRRKCLAERHAKQKHGSEDAEDDGMFPCPLKEELNCPKTYTDQTGADKHSMKAHKGHRYPCPSKACDEDFSAPVDARKHGKSHGMSNLYPCPAPEGDKCSMMFPTFDEAQRHLSNRDHNKSVVCQYCSETFYDVKSRGRHGELHTHPFPCPYSWCERRFKTCHEALKHAERQVHNSVGVFYMCNAPDCRTAAMGHVMKPSKLKDHWENHARLEHVPANSEPSYERGEPRPFKSSPLYEAIYEVNSLASFESFNRGKDNGVHPTMTTDPDVENTEGDGLDLMEEDNELDLMEESSTSFEQDYDLGLLQENSSEYFSQKQRGEMLAQNTQFWENHKHQKVYLHARGRTCLGPGINTQYIVTKPCPFGATIDFDTARLRQTRRENGSKDIVLDTTCAVCSAEKRESIILRTFQSSSKRNVDMDLLREIFGRTLHKRWSAQPSYERVKQRLEEIRKGNQPDIKPLILDTEYTIAGQQLMEFSFIDFDSGDVLINTLVEHSQGIRHIDFSRDPSTRRGS